MMKVLIVEDEKVLARDLAEFLTNHGIDARTIGDGQAALDLISREIYDAIVLDWLLPGIEGIDILRAMRAEKNLTPVLMLTAQSGLQHRLQGLTDGADDYVTKPFHAEEVYVRLKSIIRRSQQPPSLIYQAGGYSYSVSDRTVSNKDKSVELSEKEADILSLLFQNVGEPVSRDKLLQEVWGYSFDPKTNVVEVYMRMLRVKLDEIGDVNFIKTQRGKGYYIPKES